jgi:6-phosphogluconolactonase
MTDYDIPHFDLIFLGMGDDGHTASLFPGTDACHEGERLAVAQWVDKVDMYRVTLTPPVLQHARNVVFMVTGNDKAETLCQVLYGPINIDMYPSQLLRQAKGHVVWMVDKEAAKEIENRKLNVDDWIR